MIFIGQRGFPRACASLAAQPIDDAPIDDGNQPWAEVVSKRLGSVQRRIMALLEGKPSGESLYGKAFAKEFAGWDQKEVQRSLNSLEARGLIRREGPLPRYITT